MFTPIPSFLYHGSVASGITHLEPRKRYTPGNEINSPECVYATDDPAFAAAHAFPWASLEGIDLFYDRKNPADIEQGVYLEVPAAIFSRLNQPISIYTLENKNFIWVEEEVVGRTYRSLGTVKCISEKRFNTVIEAVEHFGGVVVKI